MITSKVLDEYKDIDRNPYWHILRLKDTVGINEWHSFCLSYDLDKKLLQVVQNGKIIGLKELDIDEKNMPTLRRLMSYGNFAGLTGSIADMQIFARPLKMDEQLSWTTCKDKPKVNQLGYLQCIHFLPSY